MPQSLQFSEYYNRNHLQNRKLLAIEHTEFFPRNIDID